MTTAPIMLAAGLDSLPLLTTIAAAFAAAWVMGLITMRLGLSPIVGYLLAGVIIGPHTPGFAGDVHLAQQLAEVGVILLMFGVGLHFHLKDLLAVKGVAIPGAVGQSLLATLAALGIYTLLGWPAGAGLVVGVAMAVASTVVLLRVLLDRGLLQTPHGHAAVGWLIVEDILTVLILVLLPLFAAPAGGASGGGGSLWLGLLWALVKLTAMVALVFGGGSRVVPWVLARIARTRSSELFTLTVLVLSIAIAVGSAALFGASVALGAFLAGMVVAQSRLSHQAAADALPMRHAFAVLFFVSVGMLLDPAFLLREPLLIAAGLAVVLIVKPLAAVGIVALCGWPARTGLTVALGLAQIGEFSFIVAQTALQHRLIPEEGMQVLVAVAILSITLNPVLFKSLDGLENGLRRVPWLWRILNARHDRRVRAVVAAGPAPDPAKPLAVIAGYGPVGRVVDALLRDGGVETVIVDTNLDTIESLAKSGRPALCGDASRPEILEEAGLRRASHLVVTLPTSEGLPHLVMAARTINPTAEITVRTRYLSDGESLREAGAAHTAFEEGEVGLALARQVLHRRGIPDPTVEKLLAALRSTWKM